MAQGASSDITPVLTTAYGKKLYSQWNRLANTVTNCVTLTEGWMKQAFWASTTGGSTVTTVSENDDLTSLSQDDSLPMNLARGIYQTGFSVSDSEIAQAERSPLGPLELANIVERRFFEKSTSLWKRINADFLKANGTDPGTSKPCIVGLESALNTAGTYAGQTSVSGLASNISGATASPAALTLAQMDQDLTNIYVSGGERPDWIVMHPYVFAKFKALGTAIQSIQQVNGAPVGNLALGANSPLMGNVVAAFDNIPIVVDTDGYVTGVVGNGNGNIYYLKKDSLELEFLPYRPRPDELASFNMPALNSNGDVSDMVPFMFNVYKLGRKGGYNTYGFQVECQAKVLQPNRMGIRRGVSI